LIPFFSLLPFGIYSVLFGGLCDILEGFKVEGNGRNWQGREASGAAQVFEPTQLLGKAGKQMVSLFWIPITVYFLFS